MTGFYATRPISRWLLVLIIAGLIGGCAGPTQKATQQQSMDNHRNPRPVQPGSRTELQPIASEPSPSMGKLIRSAVHEWEGTPHRMGGTGRNGIDCSGFVQRIYHDLFSRSIPRTTRSQVQSGIPVPQRQLLPGDLVFFRPPQKAGHVGIYLGGEEFAHASTSKGVTISSLNEPYWRQCYWTARRYLY